MRLLGIPVLALVLSAAARAGAASPAAVASAHAPAAAGAEASPVSPAEPPPDAPPSPARRVLNGAAAVVPGVLVHGSGHLVASDPATGYALLAAEGAGLGMVLGSGTVLVLTGASRYFVGPAAAGVILGVGLFGMSFAADLYGTLSSDGGAAALVPRVEASFESELGYRYVSDPRFEYEHFAVQRVSWRNGSFRLTPSGWFAANGTHARYRLEGAYRFLGPEPERPTALSDHVDLVLGGLHQRHVPERFTRTGAELGVEARYDLGHIGPSLRGAFVDFGTGVGVATLAYDLRGLDVPNDVDAVLLATFGFGVVLRGRTAPGSSVKLFYDHRHDELASGWLMPGLGSGVAGHFGTEARLHFSERVGILLEAQAGSALLGGISLLLREGAQNGRRRTP